MWNDEPECMCVGVASYEYFIATHAALLKPVCVGVASQS